MKIDAADLAELTHGLTTTWWLRAAGMTRSEIRWLTRSGQWEDLGNGVLRRKGTPRTVEQQMLAAVVLVAGRRGHAAVSYESAGWLWSLDGMRPRPIHVVTTRSRVTTAPEGSRIRRMEELPSRWTTQIDGITVCRPELLALHLFADFREETAIRRVEQMWSKRLLSGASIIRFLAQLGERGRDGTAGLRRYIDERGPDYTPPASGIEARAMTLFESNLMEFRRQVDTGAADWTGRVDFRHESLPVVVEVMSERYHRALVDVQADARRTAQLESDGFIVVEVWDDELFQRPGPILERVDDALREARARVSAQARAKARAQAGSQAGSLPTKPVLR